MENFIFCINATLPVFLIMLFGMLLKKANMINDAFITNMNAFVFSIALPILLFHDLSTVDMIAMWDTSFVMFCFLVTSISILLSVLVAWRLKNKSIQGEFIQASYRSSAAILGIAIITNLYGSSSLAPLMILASVPLYNVSAVIILAFLNPNALHIHKTLVKTTLKNIIKNPIIIGIAAGLIWSLLQIPQPVIMRNTLQSISNLATPLGLMAMGASFSLHKLGDTWKPALLCSSFKLVIFVALFLPVAIYLGFTHEKLTAILIMLGSAATVSCYSMAKQMGHAGTLTSSVVMITTLCSSFTLTFWLYFLKLLHLI